MNDPYDTSLRPDIVLEPRASRSAGSLEKFGLLAEPVMIAGIVEWPRDLYN